MNTKNTLLAILGGAVAYTGYTRLESNNRQNAINLVKKWLRTINLNRPSEAVELYSTDAVLVPTISSSNAIGSVEILAYMEKFFVKSPFGKLVREDEFTFRPVGTGIAICEGFYDFTLQGEDVQTDESGEITSVVPTEETVNCRFTFVFRRRLLSHVDLWEIISQQSSVVPFER